MEAQRGSYSADYGDRTYGIFNVAPRTGFERNNEAELVLSAGNFYQTDDQLNFGGHTNRFAYYASVNGNRTNLGLQTPTSAVIHDAANGFGGFTSLIYNADSQDQFRLVAQLRRDFYQVPFDANDPGTQGQFLRDANRENDSFATFSWVARSVQGLCSQSRRSITTTEQTIKALCRTSRVPPPKTGPLNTKVGKQHFRGSKAGTICEPASTASPNRTINSLT